MEAFLGEDSFDKVTNLIIFVFFLANLSIGLIIHLLSGILSQLSNKNIISNTYQTSIQSNKNIASEGKNNASPESMIQSTNFVFLNKFIFKIQQAIKE